MNDSTFGRRDFLRAGVYSSALFAGGAALASLAGCSASTPRAAEGFRYLRPADVELLAPLVPAILGAALQDEHKDTIRALALLDGTLADASPTVRKALFQLYDLLQLGAARWWLTGSWAHPAQVSAEARTEALQHWQDKNNSFARIAFRGLTQPVLMVWYAVAENGLGVGYPGPPKKVVA